MRIGFCGRFGIALVLFAFVTDFILRLVWISQNPGHSLWEPSDPYLPTILVLGLVFLLARAIVLAVYRDQKPILDEFSLSSAGPYIPQPGQAGSFRSTPAVRGADGGEIPPPSFMLARSARGLRFPAWVGYGLMLVAVASYEAFHLWFDSREFVPLAVAGSLDPGHNRTPEFWINLRGWYSIEVETDTPISYADQEKQPPIRWRLFRAAQVVAEGSIKPRMWQAHSFWGESGTYTLDLEVSPTDSWLVGRHLVVTAGTSLYDAEFLWINLADVVYGTGQWLLVFLVWVGLIVILAVQAQRLEELPESASLGRAPRAVARTSHWPGRQPVFRRPLGGLFAFAPLAALLIGPIALFLIPLEFGGLTPTGLKIHIPKLGTLAGSKEPWNEPVVVRISAFNIWYLNRTPVAHGELEKRLRDLLLLRGDKTVYLDGDESIQYQWAVEAISEIQKAWKGKVVLVTPSMKKEDPGLDEQSPCEPVPLHTKMLESLRTASTEPYPHYYWGSALVSFRIDERGVVSHVQALKIWGEPEYGAWVTHSIAKWRFKPLPGCGTQEVVETR